MLLKITIPRKPLSTNHIYGQAKNGRRYIKEEGQLFKLEVQEIMSGKKLPYNENLHFIKIEYYFYLSDFYTKKGLLNKRSIDCDNTKKLLQDCIFKSLGIDDSAICNDSTTKRHGEKDQTIIIISVHPLKALTHEVI